MGFAVVLLIYSACMLLYQFASVFPSATSLKSCSDLALSNIWIAQMGSKTNLQLLPLGSSQLLVPGQQLCWHVGIAHPSSGI